MKYRWFFLIIILVLSGCAEVASPAPALTPTPGSKPLAGTDWKLLRIKDQPSRIEYPIYLHFWNEKMNGEMGCNSYGGMYVTEGKQIRVSRISVTVEQCQPQELMEQEANYITLWEKNLLEQSAEFTIRQEAKPSTLEIFDADGNSIFLFENAIKAK